MPDFSIANGPRGVEVPHVWTPGDGTPPITMNVKASKPRVKFDAMPGFRTSATAENNQFPKTSRIGATPFPSMVRTKTFTVEGWHQARSMDELRAMESAMEMAFGERDILGTWSATPVGATDYWFCKARVLQYEPGTDFNVSLNHVRGPYQSKLLLGLEMLDPRFYWTALVESGEFAGPITVTNLGTAPTDPVIEVVGAGSGAIISNVTTGKQLQFVGMPGGTLVVDFFNRTAVIGAADMTQFINTYTSDWWDRGQPGLRPGANVISQSGGGSVGVTFRHASW